MPSVGLLDYVEDKAGHPIGWEDMDNWSESQIRRLHGNAKNYVELGGTLDDDEVVIYVSLLRRADDLDMDLERAANSILEVLL